MSQYFQPYLYFNGEETNPFDNHSPSDSAMFWFYEEHFDAMFKKGDFSFDSWDHIAPNKGDKKELKKILNEKPVNKEKLFKLYIFFLLTDRLPDRHGCIGPTDEFIKMYYKLLE